jgi:L-asparaginase
VHLKYNTAAIMPLPKGKLKVFTKLDLNVAILKLFPGITPQVIDAVLGIKDLRGLVLETFGAGNAPTEMWFIKALEKAIKKGVIILNVTQCYAGRVEQGRYQTSSWLKKIGVVGGEEMTTEAAITKLMYLTGKEKTSKTIISQLKKNLRGELNGK